MANIAENKIRIQVIATKELVARIDEYAALMGTSRSSLCSQLISMGVMSFDKAYAAVDDIANRVGDKLISDLGKQGK